MNVRTAPTQTEIIVSPVTPEIIRDLRRDMRLSLAQFGLELKRATNPGHWRKSYSRQYISALEHGRERITPEISAAIWSIAAAFDGEPAGLGGAVSVRVSARPGQVPDGTYIPASAEVDRCARPGCNVLFLRVNHFQKYHDPACRPK